MLKITMIGRVVKCDGWTVSVYRRVSDSTPTVKIRKVSPRKHGNKEEKLGFLSNEKFVGGKN